MISLSCRGLPHICVSWHFCWVIYYIPNNFNCLNDNLHMSSICAEFLHLHKAKRCSQMNCKNADEQQQQQQLVSTNVSWNVTVTAHTHTHRGKRNIYTLTHTYSHSFYMFVCQQSVRLHFIWLIWTKAVKTKREREERWSEMRWGEMRSRCSGHIGAHWSTAWHDIAVDVKQWSLRVGPRRQTLLHRQFSLIIWHAARGRDRNWKLKQKQ